MQKTLSYLGVIRSGLKLGGGSATPHAAHLLRILIKITLLLLSIHLLLQFLNLNVYHQQNGQIYELSNRFDFDDEASVPTWFSQFVFLGIGLFAFLAAYLEKKALTRRFWKLIAVMGLIFSVDEVAGLHERVLQTLHVLFFEDAAPSGISNAWWLIIPFVILIGGWLAKLAFQLLPRRTMALLVTSGVVFVFGAVAVDLIAGVVYREWFFTQGILVAVEEIFELSAAIIIMYAIADYLEARHATILKTVRQNLSTKK